MTAFDTLYLFLLMIFMSFTTITHAQLSKNFYTSSCPDLGAIVKSIVDDVVANEPRMGGSLLQLHFHDCFVNGCDGSVLLDVVGGEKESVHNAGALRGFEIIDTIKEQVEDECPGVVSCADILALTARDSVIALGGPSWKVLLGRKDSTRASSRDADPQLPFGTDDLDALISLFSRKGFSVTELVALSGAHTLGKARCIRFRNRIYREKNIAATYAESLQRICPATPGNGDNNLSPLDVVSPTTFDNGYYKALTNFAGLLHSDQALFNGGKTDSLVRLYANDMTTFFEDFAAAMFKVGNLGVLTGSNGVIRTNCRVVD